MPVAALDTNVLLRHLVGGDAAERARTATLFEQAKKDGTRLFVSDIVLCELARELVASHGTPRAEVARLLDELLGARQLAFRDTDSLRRALESFRSGRGELSDYVIREHAQASGFAAVSTFDEVLLEEPGFELPEEPGFEPP